MKSDVADFQRVVEALRDLRASNVLILTDEVRRYATDYATLCRTANDRLRQCSTLVQQGFRSEAIHLAEEPPNLLDLVAALDLPEPEIWAEFCQQHDLPVPPPLQLDRAAQLNDAYEQEQPLKALLARHRRLALARAPIKRRLDVMRQIYDLDPSAAFWDNDLRLFERARFNELTDGFHMAMKSRDIPAVQAIADEVRQTPWLETPPEPLRSNADRAAQQIQQAISLVDLRRLTGSLREAFAARDQATCRELLQQVRDLLSVNAQIPVPNELAAEIQPAADWIKREDQIRVRHQEIETASKRLSDAMRADLTDAEVNEAYQALRTLGSVPPDLDEQYRTLIASRTRQRQSARNKKLALIGTLVLVLSGVGALIAQQFLHSSAVSDWTRRLRAAVNSKDVELSRHLIKEQERQAPQLSSAPSLAAVKKEATVLEEHFNHDATTLNTLLSSLRQSADTATTAFESANASPNDLVAASDGIADALQRAAAAPDLSWVDREQRVKAMVGRLEGLKASLAQKTNSTVAARLDEMSRQFDQMNPGHSPADIDAASARITEAMVQARALQRVPGLDEETKASVARFLENTQTGLTVLQALREQLMALKAIVDKPASSDAVKTMLEAFIAKYPNAPITTDFTRALDAAKLGKALEDWRDIAGSWGGKVSAGRAAGATRRIESIDAYLKAHPASPLAAPITAYHDYLKQAADTLSEKGPWQQAFSELLASPLLTDVHYIDVSNGKRYWILGNFTKTDRRLGDRGEIEFEAIDPKNLTKRIRVRIPAPLRLLTEKPIVAPHTSVVADMAAQIKLIDENNWATWGIDYAERLAKNNDMDPVVKAILMQQVLKTTRQVAGWGVGDLYDKAIRDLARHELENVTWYNPDQPVAAGIKTGIQKVMEAIPAASAARAMLNSKEAEFAALLGFTFTGTGILMKDPAGAWRVHAPGTHIDGTGAFLIRPGPRDPNVSPFIPLAQYKDGQFVIMESAVQGLPQGTLVIIRRP